jgi:hypothetical protein
VAEGDPEPGESPPVLLTLFILGGIVFAILGAVGLSDSGEKCDEYEATYGVPCPGTEEIYGRAEPE